MAEGARTSLVCPREPTAACRLCESLLPLPFRRYGEEPADSPVWRGQAVVAECRGAPGRRLPQRRILSLPPCRHPRGPDPWRTPKSRPTAWCRTTWSWSASPPTGQMLHGDRRACVRDYVPRFPNPLRRRPLAASRGPRPRKTTPIDAAGQQHRLTHPGTPQEAAAPTFPHPRPPPSGTNLPPPPAPCYRAPTMIRLLRHPAAQTLLARLLGLYLAFALRTTRWHLEGAEHLVRHAAVPPSWPRSGMSACR